MRVGLISDIHGNLAALEAALRFLDGEGVDRLLCPGDLVGYGPFPNECVALVAERDVTCVAGNHDLMATDRLPPATEGSLPRVTIDWTRSVLSADARAYLEALPPAEELDGVVMAHGSLDDPTVYVHPEHADAELGRLARSHPHAALLLLGHTHTPQVHSERGGTLLDGGSGRARVQRDERTLVNPGSVGQPREWRPLVRCGVIDLDERVVELTGVAYDHRSVRRALADRGLPPDACHRRPPLVRALRARIRRLTP